jgi:hypothetical protein
VSTLESITPASPPTPATQAVNLLYSQSIVPSNRLHTANYPDRSYIVVFVLVNREPNHRRRSEDLIYFGITLFGDSQKLAKLTRKFSLFSI